MKILLINNQHNKLGGADTVYFNTAKLLESNGHEIAFFSSLSPNNIDSKQQQYFVEKFDFRNETLLNKITNSYNYIYNKEASIKLDSLINDFKPDVAHIHLFYGNLTTSIIDILKKRKIPIVHTVHDYRLVCPVNTFLDKHNKVCEKCLDKKYYHTLFNKCSENKIKQSFMVMLEAYYWKYYGKAIYKIDALIFVSEFSKKKHLEVFPFIINKSYHLYNFKISDNEIPNTNKGNYIFYFGRLSKEKGINKLIEAFSQTNYNLKIAGSGPLSKYVKSIKKSNIEYVGWQTGDSLNSLIKHASFIIVPSEWYENNPMTVVESFSMGKPVIGSNIGGIPELVIENKTGFLFEMGDKDSLLNTLHKAYNVSSIDYTRLSKNALDFANKNFRKDNHYNKLIEIYSKIIPK